MSEENFLVEFQTIPEKVYELSSIFVLPSINICQNISDYIEKCRAEPQNVTLDEDHSNGFYFDIDEDIMAEDSYDRSGSLEVEDDGIEDYLTWWCRGRHRHLC